ncbi:MAG: YciI family protein [Rhodospirillales bacterium]|nr:YciI family protein [Rhodospirillales bacterium]
MLYMIYGVDGPQGPTIRTQMRDAHFKYLEDNADIMVLGGATLADEDDARTGSVLIINVAGRAEADAFAENEPFRKAGLFENITVTRMRRGQWAPENAPKTAEGA